MKLLTEKEQAQQLSISYRGIMNLRYKRLIPFVRLGNLIRYNPEAVAKALEKLTVREAA